MLGLKLLHHDHSGKLRSHENTSYIPLGILMLIVGFALAVYSVEAASPPPQSESIGITGTMPGTPPAQAAVITKPTNGQHFSNTPITISGTCPKGTLVEVFKNDIFSGSTFCTDQNTFSMEMDLLYGSNKLVVR